MSTLESLGLSPEAIARRVRSIGGSDANTIMSGDESAILALWETKTGRRTSEDLSGVLPVVMGQFTEPLNAAWFEKQTGLAIHTRGGELAHLEDAWRTATLDGIVGHDGAAIWEAKHVGQFWKDADILAKYQPQLHHNMDVAGLRKAHLSVFKGNADWLHFEVEYDAAYGAAVRKAEWQFWLAVQSDEPPVPYPTMAAPKPAAVREVDMTGSNEWGALCADYVETKPVWSKHEKAKTALKKLVEDDVLRAHGHGIAISRDKRGALRFEEI